MSYNEPMPTNDERPACGCVPDSGDERFARVCDYCGTTSAGRSCVHSEHQDPCPECDVVPVAQLVEPVTR